MFDEDNSMSSQQSNLSKFFVVAASFTIIVSGLKLAASIFVPFLLAIFIQFGVSSFKNFKVKRIE